MSTANSSFAANYLTLKYAAKKGDSLKNIIVYFLKDGTDPYEANQSLKLTMSKNTSVSKWNPFAEDVVFKLYLDPKIVNLRKYREYYIKDKEREVHHLTFFTTPSVGFFSQSNKVNYEVKYNQISLLTAGMSYSYTPFESKFSFSSSVYYATISSTSNQINGADNSSVDIPAEYGLNAYGIYKNKEKAFSFFGGLDYENLSSFNIDSIVNTDTIVIDSHSIIYATVGMNYYPLFNEKVDFKLSVSKSLVSKFAGGLSTNQEVAISGMKFFFQGNYKINEKWGAHAWFKKHNLSGDNDLSINRIGVGFSYSLF